MRTLSEIIVKKDYTVKQKARPFLDQNNPVIQKGLRFFFVFLLTAAGLGDWKTLNNMIGGLPKAIAVSGVPYFIKPDDRCGGDELLFCIRRIECAPPPVLYAEMEA